MSSSANPNCPLVITISLILAGLTQAQATHSAYLSVGHDPLGSTYLGTSNPPPENSQIHLAGGTPGYLNGVFGTENASSQFSPATDAGTVTAGFTDGSEELLSVAITVSDSAGPAHSLSSMNDPALADIVTDLNQGAVPTNATLNAYEYNSAPSQFSSAISSLSAGEAASGGKPFDLLLTASPPTGAAPLPQDYWSIDLSNEIGNLDGITSLNITDFGAIAPEPNTLSLIVVALGTVGFCRRRGLSA